ncbi:MAG: neuraminidase-like domain-containing protein [Prochloraceae cyanobacterium]|nr:neuraminidase-like domain-containing protein [Prochloraceae cyanobacterium]
MNEGSGKVIRDRAGENNGTLQEGNAKWETVNDFPGADSKVVLDFDGSSNFVEINNPFDNSTDFTISLWVKPSVINDGKNYGFIGKQEEQYSQPSLCLAKDNGQDQNNNGDDKKRKGLHYDSYSDTEERERFYGTIPNFFTSANEWVHVIWIKNGNEYRFYRNGQLFATRPAPQELYINSASKYWIGKVDNYWQGQIAEVRISNIVLSNSTLDRINRFLRLAKKLNWSFSDLDWVLTSIQANEIDEEAIKKIAKIKKIQAKYKLPLDVLCSFWHDMKTIGVGKNPEKPQDLFDRVFNNPFKEILGDQFFRLQDDIKQINLNNLDRQAETNPIVGRILAALRLNVNQLIDIVRVIWGQEGTVDLTVEKLSQLFRTSQILRLLRLNIEEYQHLLSFLSLDIKEISSLSIDRFIQITELAEWIKESKFKIDELDYIITITSNLSSNLDLGYSENDIENDIREGMKSLWQLAADSLLKPSDFIGEEIDKEKALDIFEELLERDFIKEVTSNYEKVLNISLEEKIAIVLDSEITIEEESLKEIIKEQLYEDDFQRLSQKQTQHLQKILQKAYGKQKEEINEIASFFAIEADVASSLLDFTATAPQTPDYVQLLLTPVQEPVQEKEEKLTPVQEKEEKQWSKIREFFRFLSRILLLTKKLELTTAELKCIADNKQAFGIDELSQLTISNIQTIDRFKKLIEAFSDEKDKLVEYFAPVSEKGEEKEIEELAKLTGWKLEQTSLLVSPAENQENTKFNLGRDLHKTVEGIVKLKQCFNLSHHLGVNVSWFIKLLKLENLPVAGESAIDGNAIANWQLYQDAARSVKEIAKAKYDHEEWVKVSEKLEGELSERKRDVLTAWILWKNKYNNLRDLSQDLLIDVETSSCASVSYIKEATLAIQTYLHRCRMGLEPGVNKLDIPEIWWQWMMNYRVWEANRKIFLYPENYLDPSLRQTKTPIYKELEEELLQSEVTQESVEKAYQNYFDKFAELAQLKPAGGYHCTVENSSGRQDTLYLFGRTATEPYTYYYRECINPTDKKPTWKAWQKIDLTINSEYINATYAFNKLFIFWVEVVQLGGNKTEPETKAETKATIKYSFQKFGKQWIQPQTLAKDIVIEDYDSNTDGNLWRKVNALPIAGNGSEPEKILILFGNLEEDAQGFKNLPSKQLNLPPKTATTLTIDLLQENTNVTLQNQPSNAKRSVISDSQLMAIVTNNVLYDNYADDFTDLQSIRGLVGYWPMNEGSGNVIYDRAGNKNGNLEGNPQWKKVADFPGTDSRDVLEFDGNDDYVSITLNEPETEITHTLWFKTTNGNVGLFSITNNSGSNNDRHIYLKNGNLKTRVWRDETIGTKGLNLADGQWHHVAHVIGGSVGGQQIYIDGELKATGTKAASDFNWDPTTVRIGFSKDADNDYFDGQIAEVRIWDVALSAEEITTDIISRIGLVGYWPMNEGSGNEIRDRAGNNNGTLQENPKWKIVTFRDSKSRYVLEFDGERDYISFSSSNVPVGNENYTIAAWIKPYRMGNGSQGIVGWGKYYEKNEVNALRLLDNQINNYWWMNDFGASVEDLTDRWHHVAATFDGTTRKIFLDGEEVDSDKPSGHNVTHKDNLTIGRTGPTQYKEYFKGLIAEVSIWNVALSAEQIKSASIPLIPLIKTNISKPHVSVSAIKNQPGWFTFDNGDEAFLAIPQKAKDKEKAQVFKQIDNSLKAVTEDGQITLSYDEDLSDISSLSELDFTFTRLTTTTIRQLSQKMFIGGLDRLLTLDSQLIPELNFDRFSPSEFVLPPNTRQLDFDGPHGIYFWEIFFHIPFLVANTLNANQRFEEAQKWYHYIFNPTVQLPDNEKGLVGYWPMDEGSGKVIRDRAGNNDDKNDGTLERNPQWKEVTDFPGAGSRKVLEFDGTDDYISFSSSNAPLGNQSYTIAAWIKPDEMGSRGIVGWGNYKITNEVITLRLMGKAEATNADGIRHCWSSHDLPAPVGDLTNSWHHVAATFDGTTRKIFLDGKEVASDKASGLNVTKNDNLTIGLTWDREYFNGQIAEVRIWNVALSSKQILDEVSRHTSDRFWRYLPFRGNSLQKLQKILEDTQAIEAYNDNPFDPHAIARLRIGAYEKAIVMKYIDNLLDWADQLFVQDNRESISQATLLYLLAYDLLGDKPENLGKRPLPDPKTFQQIKEQYQNQNQDQKKDIPQFLIELENRVSDTTPIASAPFNDLNTYFCAPENEQFMDYWERVEDRLYKIRYCLSIEGVKRQLALFQAPIEPAQLVRAVAGGKMPLSVVSQLTPAVPNYRFDYMLDRAKNITSTLIQLGSSLLSALEKKDAEELALLRSSHEQSILKLITTTKEKQKEEAEETLASLQESQNSAKQRHTHYAQLIEVGLSALEISYIPVMGEAINYKVGAGIMRTLAVILYALPEIKVGAPTTLGTSFGGGHFGSVANAGAGVFDDTSSTLTLIAQLLQTIGGYERRQQEWELERGLAEIDIEQIEHQIKAQKIRQIIAEQDLTTHNKSIEQAKEIEDFLKGKFTNKELYQWMIGRLSILYFQTYKIALDMAMATQRAYQYELNKDDTYINFDYWDSLKKGLLAGESLMLGLNQLEKAYIEGNVRRLEIEKKISLLQLNHLAFQKLKETRKCEFELSEKLFDFDFPGHYCRQIKTIAISIPADVGTATLTQLSNKTLLKPDDKAVEYLLGKGEGDPPDESVLRPNWRRNQKIALSRGANDNGLFELNFGDTRYLPFEGTGAVSTWELSLPKATNRIDFETISDVIITLSYTALDGGDKFRQDVTNLDALKRYSEAYYFNLKQAFPGEWKTFMNSHTDTNSQKLNFHISSEIISPHIENAKLTQILFKLDAPKVSSNQSFITLEIANGQLLEIKLQDNNIAIVDEKKLSNEQFAGNWVINFDLNEVPDSLKKKDGFLNPEIVNNLELILIYEGKIIWENDLT